MKAASRVRLCRPEPPTPTSRAFPLGCRSTRQMREMWCSASLKNTWRHMGEEERG
jgi:hypothetical protein